MWQWFVIVAAISFILYQLRARRDWQSTIYNPPEMLPLFGSLFEVLGSMERHHDWKVEMLKRAHAAGKELSSWAMFASPPYYEVGSPRMVEYMLKTNFDNFIKGPNFQDYFMEVLGGGIFNSDGEAWRSQRKVASHMFSSRSLNEYMFKVFKQHSQTVVEKLAAVKEFEVVDMQDIFFRYTLDSICQIAFGVNLHSLTAEKAPAFATSFDFAQETSALRWFAPPFVWKMKRLLRIGNEGQMPKHVRVIDEFVYSVIQHRRENLAAYEDSGDLLSLFLIDAKKRGEDMTDKQLRDVILNFLLAGRDTTASGLTYMFSAFSTYPDIESSACDELHRVAGETGEVDESNLKELRYLEAVFMETIRLYAPVAGDLKVAVNACQFPDGSKVPAGGIVAYSPYVLARLPSHWGDDAEEFKPERWMDEDGRIKQPSNYVFPSFNAGPRLCLGKSMAIIEAKVLAASILQRFALRTVPGHSTIYRLSTVLSMKHGLKMSVRPRQNCV